MSLLVLDGRTGAILQQVPTGNVEPFGLYNRAAVDARTHRLFILEDGGVAEFDTDRLR